MNEENDPIIVRGKQLLLACLGALLLVCLVQDLRMWALTLATPVKCIIRYGILLGLGWSAYRGAYWARTLLAVCTLLGTCAFLYGAIALSTVLPTFAAIQAGYAVVLGAISAVLFLSTAIPRYQSSLNLLALTDA